MALSKAEARVAELEELCAALGSGKIVDIASHLNKNSRKKDNTSVAGRGQFNSKVDDNDDDDDDDDDDDAAAAVANNSKEKKNGRTLQRSLSWGSSEFPDPVQVLADQRAEIDEKEDAVAEVVDNFQPLRSSTATRPSEPLVPINDLFHFVCPLNRALFREPVVAADGVTYERSAFENFVAQERRKSGGVAQILSPVTNRPLSTTTTFPNLICKGG